MVHALLALALGISDLPHPKVTSISLFKNGYAVVIRETDLNTTDGRISDLPASSLGTLWIVGLNGTKILESVYETIESKTKAPAESFDELLTANIGKSVVLMYGEKTTAGQIVSASGNLVVIKTETGTMAIAKNSITGVIADGNLESKVDRTQASRALRIKTDKPGRVRLVSLERGATWAPAYAIDVSDPKKLKIVGKATILNDLDDLDNIEARLITGFPNVPFAGIRDPLVSGWTVDQFVQMIANNAGAPVSGGQMMQNRASEARDEAFDFGGGAADVGTMQAEDLFMYRQPNVKLKKGERGAYILFSAESDYENLYTWDIADGVSDNSYRGLPEGPGDVWNTLKFKNTSPLPFTTGAGTTFKNNEMLGQDLIKYTSVGAEAYLRVTKALEVRADSSEEETGREVVEGRGPGIHWMVTLKGTLEITNRKVDTVKMRITKLLTGELVAAEGSPQVSKPARGLREANPHAQLTWTIAVPPHATQKLIYTYKVFVG
jgi:hypothetical protein